MYELGSINLKKVSNKILHGDVNEKVSLVLNVVLVIYAALLPLSGAFSTHTGPYIILFLWIFEGNLINKYRKLKKEHVFLAFYALFGIYLISFLWTNNLKEGIHSLKYYLSMIIIMSVYFTSLRKKIIPYTIGAFLSSMFLSEIISYGIFLDLWRVGSRGTPENPSPFMHHIKYSIFLAITIFILIWQILNKKTDLKLKILESVFLVSATINLFLNGGRTGQIGFILAVFVFTMSYFGVKLKYLLSTFALVASITITAYHFSPIFHQRVQMGISDIEKISEGNLGTSWGLRIAMKIISYNIIKDHPMIGVGLGDFRDDFIRYLNESDLKRYDYLHHLPHVHDQFLQTAIQTGLVGLFILLTTIYFLYKKDFKDPLLKSVFISILTIMFFSFFTEASLRNNTSALLAFLIGYFWRYDEVQDT